MTAAISEQKLIPECATEGHRKSWLPHLLALACIVLIEAICFGPVLKKVGFYLDDWSMFSRLHFGPQSFFDLSGFCMGDSKVVVRPFEAPYFAALQLLFGARSLGHHLVNGAFEIASGWFFYLALARLFANRTLALSAACIFLVYPTHDCTHYWITASSATVSMAFWCASFWLSVAAAQERSLRKLALSTGLFFVSVFNYEAFIPLCALNALAASLVVSAREGWKQAVAKGTVQFLPFLGVAALMLGYQKLLLALGVGWNLPTSHDVPRFFKVLADGFSVTILPPAWEFFAGRALEFQTGIAGVLLICLLGAALFATFWAFAGDGADTRPDARILISAAVLGLTGICASYTIYGIAANYMPTLWTIMNRINFGASIGAALVVAAAASVPAMFAGFKQSAPVKAALSMALVFPLLVFLLMADWGLSKAWTSSWELQKHIRDVVARRKGEFKTGDSIVLAGAPRYVMWSPMFDGVWDFQNMVRLALDNKDIGGGVVSERIVVEPTCIKDISSGFLCGTYKYGTMFVLTPSPERWQKIDSASRFIDLIEERGMGCGLDPKMPERWRRALADRSKTPDRADD